jgi:hypothetical protein
MKRLLAIGIILLTVPCLAQGTIEIRRDGKVVATDHDESSAGIRVLFIGNSLTFWNELPWMTRRVAGSLGARPLLPEFSGMGGASLRQHWERGNALRAIKEYHWDFVVLQAQSSEMSDRPEEMMKYARLFDREIGRVGAKTVFFVTWKAEGQRGTQSELTARYIGLARELDALIAPVGVAWDELRHGGMDLFDPGGVHPNLKGSYLAACVFYSTFYGASPAGATHTFETKFDIPESYRRDLERDKLDAETAEQIQRAAWKAVEAVKGDSAGAIR